MNATMLRENNAPLRSLPPSLWPAYLSMREAMDKSTCKRRHVGCTITYFDGLIAAVGYNSETAGYPYVCKNIPRQCGCTHAEVAAASKLTVMRDAPLIAIITCAPCLPCYHALRLAGVTSFFWVEDSDPGFEAMELMRQHRSVSYQRFSWLEDQFPGSIRSSTP